MPQLYYSPALVYGGSTVFIPPWLKVRVQRSQKVEVHNPPHANRAVISSITTNQATRISLTLDYLADEPTEADVLSMLETLWSHFSGHTFTLFEWNDRGWEGCALEDFEYEHGLDPFQMIRGAGIQIVCENSAPDTNLQIEFSDYDAEYPYASKVGRPSGNMETPGAPRPVSQSMQTLPGVFPSVIEAVTIAGQEQRFSIGGVTNGEWVLERIQISGCDPEGSSGTTTIRVATYPVGGSPGSHIDASVASGAFFGTVATGNITVTTGTTLYVSIQAAGGHQDVQYIIWLRAV